MKRKTKYQEPVIEITLLSKHDVLTISGNDNLIKDEMIPDIPDITV